MFLTNHGVLSKHPSQALSDQQLQDGRFRLDGAMHEAATEADSSPECHHEILKFDLMHCGNCDGLELKSRVKIAMVRIESVDCDSA
jgi:hypothetical protein